MPVGTDFVQVERGIGIQGATVAEKHRRMNLRKEEDPLTAEAGHTSSGHSTVQRAAASPERYLSCRRPLNTQARLSWTGSLQAPQCSSNSGLLASRSTLRAVRLRQRHLAEFDFFARIGRVAFFATHVVEQERQHDWSCRQQSRQHATQPHTQPGFWKRLEVHGYEIVRDLGRDELIVQNIRGRAFFPNSLFAQDSNGQ